MAELKRCKYRFEKGYGTNVEHSAQVRVGGLLIIHVCFMFRPPPEIQCTINLPVLSEFHNVPSCPGSKLSPSSAALRMRWAKTCAVLMFVADLGPIRLNSSNSGQVWPNLAEFGHLGLTVAGVRQHGANVVESCVMLSDFGQIMPELGKSLGQMETLGQS